jgi:hypothetical protein
MGIISGKLREESTYEEKEGRQVKSYRLTLSETQTVSKNLNFLCRFTNRTAHNLTEYIHQ